MAPTRCRIGTATTWPGCVEMGHPAVAQPQLPSPHSYAVFANGCAECPRLTCGREGCGTEFCYHCRQPWHPDGPCAPTPSLATPTAQLAQPEELAHGEALAQGGSSSAGVWHSPVPLCLLPVGLLEPGSRVPLLQSHSPCASWAGVYRGTLAPPMIPVG